MIFPITFKKLSQEQTPLIDLEAVVKHAGQMLNCKPENFRKASRISQADKLNRDLLLYFLLQSGKFTNHHICEMFGLTCSAVIRRAGGFKGLLRKDSELQGKLKQLKALNTMY